MSLAYGHIAAYVMFTLPSLSLSEHQDMRRRLSVGPAGTMTNVWGSQSVTWRDREPSEPRSECLSARAPSDSRGVVWEPDVFTLQEDVSHLDQSEKQEDSYQCLDSDLEVLLVSVPVP